WLATQSTQSLASQGGRLFQQLGCNGCHRSDSLARAPMLEGLYGRPVRLQDGSQVIADDAYLRNSVLNPSAQVVDGWQPIMPPFPRPPRGGGAGRPPPPPPGGGPGPGPPAAPAAPVATPAPAARSGPPRQPLTGDHREPDAMTAIAVAPRPRSYTSSGVS